MLSCREVMVRVSSGEIADASWSQRAAIGLHKMMCRHCRAYVRQLRVISKAARRAWALDKQDASTLEALKQRILRQSKPKQSEDLDQEER